MHVSDVIFSKSIPVQSYDCRRWIKLVLPIGQRPNVACKHFMLEVSIEDLRLPQATHSFVFAI
jgi:hypothetical protein